MGGKIWLILGALSAAVAVSAGAARAHALKDRLEPRQLEAFQTAAHYQIYHALALLLVGVLAGQRPEGAWIWPAGFFLAGTLLFSGGIYAWVATGIQPLVHLVPLGGFSWIVGWLVLAIVAARSKP